MTIPDDATNGDPRPASTTADELTRRFGHFYVEFDGPVAILTINRPAKKNSMAADFWDQLCGVFAALEREPHLRAVILTGAGDNAFSAGGDLTEFGEPAEIHERREYMAAAMAGFAALEESRLPIVAAVNGWALGGGCEITFACDIVIASESAQFGMPEAGAGLVPGFGVVRAPSVLGAQWTKYLVFANRTIGAQQAYRLGMVQEVVPDDELRATALELATRIAHQAPLAISVAKRIIGRDHNRGDTSHAVDSLALLFSTNDAAEGMTAFRERRAPDFRGE